MLADRHLTPEHEAAVEAGQGGPVFFGGSQSQYVVMRSDVYDAMLGIGDDTEAATLEAVRRGLADVQAGRTQDADEFFDELARKYES
jgi:predicted transcriptional regulator